MPQVSIITPTFNRASVLPAAIESVRRQTIDDYEHIIVDDGSTDDTQGILDREGESDPRLRTIRLEENHGHATAMNRGLEAATAPYISFLDSDDTYVPKRLERTVSALSDASADLGGVCHSFIVVRRGVTSLRQIPPEIIDRRRFADRNVIAGMSNTLVRTDTARAIGGFDESLQSSVDYDFQLRLLGEQPMLGLDDPLSIHRKDVYGVQDNPLKIKQGLLGVIKKHHQMLSDRNTADRLSRIGRASLHLGRHDDATKYLDAAQKICPDDHRGEIARSIGVSYLLNGDERRASRCFLTCLRHDPLNYKAFFSLLSCLLPVDGASAHVAMREYHSGLRLPFKQAT